MTSWGSAPYEINVPSGGIAIVGRDPGQHEVREGRPFVEWAPAGSVLAACMNEAGIPRTSANLLNVSRERPPANKFEAHRRDALETEIAHLHTTLRRLKPNVIVALGAQAAHALIPDWPDTRVKGEGLVHRGTIKRAADIENRRGYVFDSPFGPVVASIHPADVARTWVPWRVLLSQDLQRAKEIASHGCIRPTRRVTIVSSDHDARRAVAALRRHRRLAGDIETWRDSSLACLGFAGSGDQAYVFPAQYLNRAAELLRDPELTTVWANGIYDLLVLKHRYGIDVRNRLRDVQLGWHACYPELAGQKEDKRKQSFTRKSLSFLASLVTYDRWWKGDYETTEEFFLYNGKDCCITYDVDVWVEKTLDEVGARDVYEFECASMMPCVDMLQRGLYVNNDLRLERIEALQGRSDELRAGAQDVVVPLLERERDRLEAADLLRLFEVTDPTCRCCRHASKKQHACWACAGFNGPPKKAEVVEAWTKLFGKTPDPKARKADLEADILPVCNVCEGVPRQTRLVFNPNSDAQAKAVLYEVLRLPKRFKRNSKGESVLTTDENALKSLLGVISE